MSVLNFLFTADKLRMATAAILFGTLTLGCSVRGSGHVVEERREFEYYDSVALGDGFVGTVSFGSEYSLVVEADDNLMDDVRMRVVSGRLIVDLDGLSTRDATLRAAFTLPLLHAAGVSDGGILEVEGVPLDEDFDLDLSGGSIGRVTQLSGERFESLLISSSGGSSFRVSGNADSTLVDISGGGTGTLRGQTGTMTTSLSGGSHLGAEAFSTQYLSFNLSGGSTAAIEVKEEAHGSLSGGSVLEVYGAGEVDADRSGGSVVERH